MSTTRDRVSDHLENVTALDADGEPVRLGTFWQEHPAVLVFIRHFG